MREWLIDWEIGRVWKGIKSPWCVRPEVRGRKLKGLQVGESSVRIAHFT